MLFTFYNDLIFNECVQFIIFYYNIVYNKITTIDYTLKSKSF